MDKHDDLARFEAEARERLALSLAHIPVPSGSWARAREQAQQRRALLLRSCGVYAAVCGVVLLLALGLGPWERLRGGSATGATTGSGWGGTGLGAEETPTIIPGRCTATCTPRTLEPGAATVPPGQALTPTPPPCLDPGGCSQRVEPTFGVETATAAPACLDACGELPPTSTLIPTFVPGAGPCPNDCRDPAASADTATPLPCIGQCVSMPSHDGQDGGMPTPACGEDCGYAAPTVIDISATPPPCEGSCLMPTPTMFPTSSTPGRDF